MKPKNTDKDMWLWDQTAYQKSQENTQIQDIYCMQSLSVFYMTQLEAKSQQ